MNRKILITIVASVFLMAFSIYQKENNQDGEIVKTIKFDGGSCELHTLNKRPMFSPATMQQGEKAFELALKYTLDNNDETDKLSVLFDEGEFIASDEDRFKAGAARLLRNDHIYNLVVAIPESIDAGTLRFVYNNQEMLLEE